jgi:hypothetical protein
MGGEEPSAAPVSGGAWANVGWTRIMGVDMADNSMGVMQVSGVSMTLGMSREPRMGQTEDWLRATVGNANDDPYLTLYCMAGFPQTRFNESADREDGQTVKLCKV